MDALMGLQDACASTTGRLREGTRESLLEGPSVTHARVDKCADLRSASQGCPDTFARHPT